jgi:hypothetical protein
MFSDKNLGTFHRSWHTACCLRKKRFPMNPAHAAPSHLRENAAAPAHSMEPASFSWRRKFRRISRRALIGFGIVLAVLVVIRLALPSLVLRYANNVLSELPDYRGYIEEVDISLWRGAYQLRNLRLDKRTDKKTYAPFLWIPTMDFSVEWKALFLGSVVGEVDLFRPELNFVDAPTQEQSQLTIDQSWGDKFERLFPLQINRLRIREGTATFKNPTSTPPVDLKLTQVEVLGTNLTNSSDSKEPLASKVDINARALKTGKLRSRLEINPIAARPDFFFSVQLDNVVLTEMNNFLRAYANVDAEKGQFEVYAEVRVANDRIEGYLKPIIQDLKLVDLEDIGKNPLRLLWETIVSGITFIFTNHARDSVATKIPFSGTVDEPDPDWLALIGGLLHNAYIRHISPGLDKDGLEIRSPNRPVEKGQD